MRDDQWITLCAFMHAMLQDEGNEHFKTKLREYIGDPFNQPWEESGMVARNAARKAYGHTEANTWDMERGAYPFRYWGGPGR